MATHDYIISNASGAAVRADLNNALAAIVSNNSNASSPSTTYAYQWWADTTTGQLKLRNSANNAWITIFELDGTMLMEDGTVSAPGLAFASDLNTGFFRSAADKINFATGGVERLEIGSSEVVFNDGSNDVDFRVESNGQTHMLFVDGGNDRVGIGTSAPASLLDIQTTTEGNVARFRASDDVRYLQISSFNAGANGSGYDFDATSSSGALSFSTVGSERFRIDASGRLLVGTTSSTKNIQDNDKQAIVLQGNANNGGLSVTTYNGTSFSDTTGPRLNFQRSRGTADGTMTVVSPGDLLGEVEFRGADGTNFISAATVSAFSDDTPGTNDMPGRLVFSTTADGASSPTERLRIDSSGRMLLGTTTEGLADGNNLTIADSGACGITLRSGSSSGGAIYFSDATSGAGEYAGFVEYLHSSDALRFASGGTERMRIDSSGNVTLGRGGTSLHFENGFNNSTSRIQNGGGSNSSNFKFLVTNSGSESEAMRLDSSGRLLVGTSSSVAFNGTPSAIQVQGDVDSKSRISIRRIANDNSGGVFVFGKSRSSGHAVLQNNDTIGKIEWYGADGSDTNQRAAIIAAEVDGTPGSNDMPGRLVFSTCSDGTTSVSERMRIRNDGTVLVGGTTVVSRSQHVLFEVGEGSNSFDIQRNNGSNVIEVSCQVGTTSGRTIQNFINPNGSVGGISISGSATTFETSSDYRLKENIVDLADGINRIKQLSPRRFNFIADANKTVDGFIAHEAQTIVPEAVRGAHNEVDDDGNAVMQGIDQSKLVPLLTAALQEAITKIETLETKVAALEAG